MEILGGKENLEDPEQKDNPGGKEFLVTMVSMGMMDTLLL
jgi:hypothetical protein